MQLRQLSSEDMYIGHMHSQSFDFNFLLDLVFLVQGFYFFWLVFVVYAEIE